MAVTKQVGAGFIRYRVIVQPELRRVISTDGWRPWLERRRPRPENGCEFYYRFRRAPYRSSGGCTRAAADATIDCSRRETAGSVALTTRPAPTHQLWRLAGSARGPLPREAIPRCSGVRVALTWTRMLRTTPGRRLFATSSVAASRGSAEQR